MSTSRMARAPPQPAGSSGPLARSEESIAQEADHRLMDHRGGRERVVGPLPPHQARSDLAQFVIDQGDELTPAPRSSPARARPRIIVSPLHQFGHDRGSRRETKGSSEIIRGTS